MKSKKLGLIPFFILTMSFTALYAQNAVLSAGGDATGTGGSLAYSVGQPSYTNYDGESGSMNLGVQQPYIVIMVGTEEPDIRLTTTIYPNPVTTSVNLQMDKNNPVLDLTDYSFNLYNVNGKMILHQEITATSTAIPMENLGDGIYLLSVIHKNSEIKTFKIFKTN